MIDAHDWHARYHLESWPRGTNVSNLLQAQLNSQTIAMGSQMDRVNADEPVAFLRSRQQYAAGGSGGLPKTVSIAVPSETASVFDVCVVQANVRVMSSKGTFPTIAELIQV